MQEILINGAKIRFLLPMVGMYAPVVRKVKSLFYPLTTSIMMAQKCVEKSYIPATGLVFING